ARRTKSFRPQPEGLENRMLLTLVPSFEWSMADRFGVDHGRTMPHESTAHVGPSGIYYPDLAQVGFEFSPEPDGRIDLRYDTDFVQAERYRVMLDASSSRIDSPSLSNFFWPESIYSWTIQPIGVHPEAPITTSGQFAAVDLRQGADYVTLSIRTPWGEEQSI